MKMTPGCGAREQVAGVVGAAYLGVMRNVVLLIMACVMLSGCGSLRYKGQGADTEPVARGDWPFWPVVMRVHPFTLLRVDEAAGSARVDARVELVDPVGDVVKGVGTFRFELYAERRTASRDGEQRRLYVWDASIESIDDNIDHYDPITRTYEFKLNLSEPPPPERKLRLRVQFESTTGYRLNADAVVEVRPET